MDRILIVLLLLAACGPKDKSASPGGEQPSAPQSVAPPGQRSLPTLAADAVGPWFVRMDARLQPLVRSRDSVAALLRRDSATTRADSVFVAFRARYTRAVDSIGSETWGDAPFQNWLMSSPAASDSAERFFATRGLRLTWSEGSGYPTENTAVLVRPLQLFVTAALRDFLALRDHDEAQGFSDDAMLRIPWDSVSERVAAWDHLVRAHPNLVTGPEAQQWYDLYLSTYLTGMDNSPVFDDTLITVLRASYGRFLRLHGDTRAGRLVSAYLGVLRSTGFRHAAPVDSFLRANGIRSMFATQPPIR